MDSGTIVPLDVVKFKTRVLPTWRTALTPITSPPSSAARPTSTPSPTRALLSPLPKIHTDDVLTTRGHAGTVVRRWRCDKFVLHHGLTKDSGCLARRRAR